MKVYYCVTAYATLSGLLYSMVQHESLKTSRYCDSED